MNDGKEKYCAGEMSPRVCKDVERYEQDIDLITENKINCKGISEDED